MLSVAFAATVWAQGQAQIINAIDADTLIVTHYDTVVVFHHPEFQSCSMTNWNYCIPDAHFAYGTMEEYYHYVKNYLYDPVDGYDTVNQMPVTYYPRSLWGSFFGKNNYSVEAYGQPFHFDRPVTVIGVAAPVRGHIYGLNKDFYITTEKENFVPLASAPVYPPNVIEGNPRDTMWYYFFNQGVTRNDFIIAGETYFDREQSQSHIGFSGNCPIPHPYLEYNATFSISDTIWRDTTYGCQGTESPWFRKDGQWHRFEDDTVYYMVKNSTLNFNPIIVVSTTSSIDAADLAKTCSIYPNPTKDDVLIQSDFKLRMVEVYDEMGRKLREIPCSAHELRVDLRGLPPATYIFKLRTVKGEIEKKVIKQ